MPIRPVSPADLVDQPDDLKDLVDSEGFFGKSAANSSNQAGLLVALMSLFDSDGNRTLTRDEWMGGNEALELETSESEWQALLKRFHGLSTGVVDFAEAVEMFGEIKPVEGFLEEVLRRFMRSLVSLTQRVRAAEQASMRERQTKLNAILRTWKHRHTQPALEAWKALLESKRAATRRAVNRWTCGVLATTLYAWRDAVHAAQLEKHAHDEARLHRAVGRWSQRLLATVFVPWALLAERTRRAKQMGRRAMLRLSHRLLSTTYFAWAEHAAGLTSHRQALLSRSGARLRNRGAVFVFEAWRDIVRGRVNGREERYANAIRRLRNRTVAIALEAWAALVQRQRAICRRAAFVIGPGRWQAICFRTWRAKQLEARQRREREEVFAMLEKAIPDVHTLTSTIERLEADVRRLQKQMESTVTTSARDREQRIQQTIRQWCHQSLATAFDGWRGLLEARREAMRKAVGQWAHGVLAFTFHGWRELLVTKRADEAAKLTRAVGRWARRELSGGFGHWSSFARAARTSKAQLRRAVGRWSQRLLATVVGSWAEYVSRSRRAKARGDQALRRMSHGLLGATYWAWAEHVAETVARRQEVLRRTGARLANRTLVLTIEAWRALAADSVSRREGLWHKAVAMLRGRVAGLALYAWIEYLQRRKQVLRKAAYALGPGYSLSLGFRTWLAVVREGLRAHERERTLELLGEALPELVRGVLAEITGGGAAMLGDRAEVEELARELRELKKSMSSNAERAARDREHKINQTIRTWKHQHLARAFDGWSGLITERKASIRRAIGHWVSGLLGQIFRLWCEAMSHAHHHRRSQLNLAARRWAQRLLSVTFGTWSERTARARRAKEMGRRAMLRLTHGLLSSTYWAWAEHVAETVARRQEVLRRTGARLANRTLVLTIEAWRDVVRGRVNGREERYANAIRRLRNRTVAIALEAWMALVQRQRAICQRAAFVIGPGYSLSLGFRTWLAVVREGLRAHERERTLELLGEALPELVIRLLPSVLGANTDQLTALQKDVLAMRAREQQQREHTVRKVLRSWKHQHTSRAFDGWKALVRERRAALWRSIGHWIHRHLAAFFRIWQATVTHAIDEKRSREQAHLSRAVGRWSQRLLATVFVPWALLAERTRRAKQMGRRAMLRLSHRLLSTTYFAWADLAAAHGAGRREMLRRAAARFRGRLAMLALEAWRHVVTESAHRRAELFAHAARHFRGHLGALVFDAWRAFLKWKYGLLRRVLAPAGVVGACFRRWCELRAIAQRREEDAQLLEGLRHVGTEWLLSALGDVLPALLPEESIFQKVATHELRVLLSSRGQDARQVELSAAQTRGRMQVLLGHLVHEQGSVGASQLLALSRALDSQAARWDRSSARLEHTVEELKQRSRLRELALEAELTQMQRHVTDQTRAYLAATSTKSAKEEQLDGQLAQLKQTAAELARRLLTVDEQLMHTPDVQWCAELSAQIELLASQSAGRDELQGMLELLQRPVLAIKELKGPFVVVQTSERNRLGSRPLSGGAGAALSASQRARLGGGGSVKGGSVKALHGTDQYESHVRPLGGTEQYEFLAGTDGAIYKGALDDAVHKGQAPSCAVAALATAGVTGTPGAAAGLAVMAAGSPPTAPHSMPTPRPPAAQRHSTGARPSSARAAGRSHSQQPTFEVVVSELPRRSSSPSGDRSRSPTDQARSPAGDLPRSPTRDHIFPTGDLPRSPTRDHIASLAVHADRPRSAKELEQRAVERLECLESNETRHLEHIKEPEQRAATLVQTRLGGGYLEARWSLVAAEASLQRSRECVLLCFGGGREMWVQWTSSGTASKEDHAGIEGRWGLFDSAQRVVFKGQRPSLDDFLTELEASYEGYSTLERLFLGETLLWTRLNDQNGPNDPNDPNDETLLCTRPPLVEQQQQDERRAIVPFDANTPTPGNSPLGRRPGIDEGD